MVLCHEPVPALGAVEQDVLSSSMDECEELCNSLTDDGKDVVTDVNASRDHLTSFVLSVPVRCVVSVIKICAHCSTRSRH